MRSYTHQTGALLFAENDSRNNNKDDETSAKYPPRYGSIRNVGEKEAKRKKKLVRAAFSPQKVLFCPRKKAFKICKLWPF
jgi:hypothetical protein